MLSVKPRTVDIPFLFWKQQEPTYGVRNKAGRLGGWFIN